MEVAYLPIILLSDFSFSCWMRGYRKSCIGFRKIKQLLEEIHSVQGVAKRQIRFPCSGKSCPSFQQIWHCSEGAGTWVCFQEDDHSLCSIALPVCLCYPRDGAAFISAPEELRTVTDTRWEDALPDWYSGEVHDIVSKMQGWKGVC